MPVIFSFSLLLLIVAVSEFKLYSGKDSNHDGKNNAHCIAVTVTVQFKCRIVNVVHDSVGAVIRSAGCQQLNQCETLETVNGSNNENI